MHTPQIFRTLDKRFRFTGVLWCALCVCPAAGLGQQPVTIRNVSATQNPFELPAMAGEAIGSPPGVRPSTPATTIFSLPELEQMALANNPSIGRAAALVSAARGHWVQVGLPPNPSWGYAGYQLGSGNAATQHALMVDGELVTGGKLRWNRVVAEQEVARTEQELFAQQQRVITDVQIAFYEALLAQKGLELVEQLLQIARDAQGTADRLYRAGETSRVDLRQLEIEVFMAENSLNDARTRHFAAWQSLKAVVGTPWLGPAVLDGNLEALPEPIDWEGALGRLLATSPEISAAVASVDRARAALERARREPVPNVRYQLAVMQDMGIGGKTDGIAQALLPLPILNRNQGGISQATAELAAAEQQVQQVQMDLQNRLAGVYQRYSSATVRVQRFRESILPAAKESLDIVRKGWAGGEFPFLNLLNAQRTYFLTNQQYLEALRELRTSAAQIDGLLLSDSLAMR